VANSISFEGQVVIVTGAGNGLGRGYAIELGRRGAAVIVNDLGGDAHGRGASRIADEVVDIIRASGGKAAANYDSVATRSGGEAIMRTALDQFGRVDGLINNAGILRDHLFETMTDEDFDKVIETHLKGSFHVAQAAYKAMMRGGGRILFTSSASGMFGFPAHANYASAKAGIVGLMNVVAIEGARHGILANALLPRGTSRLDQAVSDETDLNKQIPDGTELIADAFGPEYVTPLAVYLVSRECQSTHGIYSAVSNRFARAFVGLAPGWKGGAAPASVEEIHAHWREVCDPEGFSEPLSVFDEFRVEIARARQAA
jgi:NAD(P)-dependent dehydrogenase (short-subunit alcohol dehydrogenase family)